MAIAHRPPFHRLLLLSVSLRLDNIKFIEHPICIQYAHTEWSSPVTKKKKEEPIECNNRPRTLNTNQRAPKKEYRLASGRLWTFFFLSLSLPPSSQQKKIILEIQMKSFKIESVQTHLWAPKYVPHSHDTFTYFINNNIIILNFQTKEYKFENYTFNMHTSDEYRKAFVFLFADSSILSIIIINSTCDPSVFPSPMGTNGNRMALTSHRNDTIYDFPIARTRSIADHCSHWLIMEARVRALCDH